MVVTLALTAAAVIGLGDYWGGRASSSRPALVVVVYGQLIAAALGLLWVLVVGWEQLVAGDLLLGALSGVCAATASIAFFHALGNGRMSIVAPVTAATGTLIPVLVDLATGVQLRAATWTAMAVVIAAIPMVAVRPGGGHRLSLRNELLLSLLSGGGYALYFILLGHTSVSSGQWPVAASFIAGALCTGFIAIGKRTALGAPPAGAIISGLASIVAGVCITRALQIGPIALATVLGSMYPVVTSGLAVRFDRERLSPLNVIGIVLAVGGAAVVAATR